jgi:hypothetical protein
LFLAGNLQDSSQVPMQIDTQFVSPGFRGEHYLPDERAQVF